MPDKEKAAETWPKIYNNINVPAKIVNSAAEAAQLGSSWVEFNLGTYGLELAPASQETS